MALRWTGRRRSPMYTLSELSSSPGRRGRDVALEVRDDIIAVAAPEFAIDELLDE